MSHFFRLLGMVSPVKTFYFNLKYLPIRVAWRLPVLVARNVVLRSTRGTLELGSYETGAVKLGFGDVSIFDARRSRTIWDVMGKVRFAGRAFLGHGTVVCVRGLLEAGDWFGVTAESTIIARKHVKFGREALIAWGSLIMDTDYHSIVDGDCQRINPDKAISIGDHVWIGCRCTVLKGVAISNNTVVAANSCVTRKFDEAGVLLAGNPARVVRRGINWGADSEKTKSGASAMDLLVRTTSPPTKTGVAR